MTFQRCAIVVGFFFCYSLSTLQAKPSFDYDVDCEVYIYHPDCRGSQTKRTDSTNYRNSQRLEDLFGMTDNSKKSSHSSRSRNGISNNYEKSKLWTALLDRGLNPDAMYQWYLAHLEKNDGNRQQWAAENSQINNVVDGDY